ncbi:hypothetical protein L6164_037242 [Bauhinia variegata]|uniref:Uncharacterized protein n=1 Tax=Bauhinia variegata TaxID=167791 RepID=A0ACB9KJM8_BAUVA|nr:hypothetical protein L6164_037242 [Bauhinia variegata]
MQPTVSKISAEAEYREMSKGAAEVQWLIYLIVGFGVNIKTPAKLFSDYMSTIYVARNPVFHEQTKYIKMDCHYVRDKVVNGLISLQHVSADSTVSRLFN